MPWSSFWFLKTILHCSPQNGLLPHGFYSLDLLVIPKWGLYANMTAQVISQISSHFIIHYHRRIVQYATHDKNEAMGDVENASTVDSEQDKETECNAPQSQGDSLSILDKKEQGDLDNDKVQLCVHAFRRYHKGESNKVVARAIVNPFLALFSLSLSLLVIVGCVVPSYAVSILGVVGILVESGQSFEEAATGYSVTTTIRLLFDQARFTDRLADFVGLGTLSLLLILTVLIVPVLQNFLLLVQWYVPLTRKQRHQLSVASEIFQAWQYIEVYISSLLVASWQLGSISGKHKGAAVSYFIPIS